MISDMNGFTAIHNIREDLPELHCSFIFHSALHLEEDIQKANRAQGDDNLVKPIRQSVLKKHLDQWCTE